MNNTRQHFVNAVGYLQELFQELADGGKLSEQQIARFNDAQYKIVEYHKETSRELDYFFSANVVLPWSDDQFIEAWAFWKKYRKQQHKFTFKSIGEQAALRDLAKISGGDMHKAIELIHHAASKTWAGIFPMKENTSKQQKIEANLAHKQDIFNRLTNGKQSS